MEQINAGVINSSPQTNANVLSETKKARINWVDIAKGILIVFVVLGHVTPKFNFVYQFHMGAFFILSGFTSGGGKKTFSKVWFYRLMTIMVPTFFVLLFGNIVNYILDSTGNYNVLFNGEYIGFAKTLRLFFVRGDMYVQAMGACWFLTALFAISLLNKFILVICKNKASLLYLLISFGFFLLCYYFIKIGYGRRIYIFDLLNVLHGQWFFAIGYFLKEHKLLEIKLKWWLRLSVLLINVAIIIILWKVVGSSKVNVDYPEHIFHNPFRNTVVVLNGLLACVNIAYFIQMLPKKAWVWLSELGKKSLGIVFLHFAYIKIFSIICAAANYIPWDVIKDVTPPLALSSNLWPVISIFSLSLSYFTWAIAGKIPVLSFVLGQDKRSYDFIYNTASTNKFSPFKYIGKFLSFVRTKYFTLLDNLKTNFKSNPVHFIAYTSFIILCMIPMVVAGIFFERELLIRVNSSDVFNTGLKYSFSLEIQNGNFLSAPFLALGEATSYSFQNHWIFKTIQILSVFVCVISFAWLIFKVFKNKKMALFCGVIVGAFIPISYDIFSPNAYNVVYTIPLTLAFISLGVFVNYLNCKQRIHLIESLVLYTISCLFFEEFLLFIVLFVVFSLTINKSNSTKENIKRALLPSIATIIIFVTYLILRVCLTDASEGKITANNFFTIFFDGMASSTPACYLFKNENIYYGSFIGAIDIIRIVAFSLLFIFVIFNIRKNSESKSDGWKKLLLVCSVSFFVVVVFLLPSSFSMKNQMAVDNGEYRGTHSTFLSYLFLSFIISYLIWNLVCSLKNKVAKGLIYVVLSGAVISVSTANSAVSNKQYQEYTQISEFESLIKTNAFKYLDKEKFYSTDIFFETDGYRLPDTYWDTFSKKIGLSATFINDVGGETDNIIYRINNSTYALWIKENLLLMSKSRSNVYTVPTRNSDYIQIDFSKATDDKNGWRACGYYFEENESYETEIKYINVGSSRHSVLVKYGYFPADGWIENESEFLVRTKSKGQLQLAFYQTTPKTEKNSIKVYINNELALSFNFEPQYEVHTIETLKHSVLDIRIESENVVNKGEDSPDIRKLSVILAAVNGL